MRSARSFLVAFALVLALGWQSPVQACTMCMKSAAIQVECKMVVKPTVQQEAIVEVEKYQGANGLAKMLFLSPEKYKQSLLYTFQEIHCIRIAQGRNTTMSANVRTETPVKLLCASTLRVVQHNYG